MPDKEMHPYIAENQQERTRALPTYCCKKTAKPHVIDGVFEKDFWKDIESTGNFWFVEGHAPARFHTEAKLCWDDENIYIAFDVEDHNICATYTKRKDPVYAEDVVEVFISPYNSVYKYYELNVNPINTIYDSLQTNKVEEEGGKGVYANTDYTLHHMQTAVDVRGTVNDPSVEDEGYSVEYAIPFSDFEPTAFCPPKAGTVWRMNLYRIDGMPQTDFYAWSPNYFKFPQFHLPSGFGYLKFIE